MKRDALALAIVLIAVGLPAAAAEFAEDGWEGRRFTDNIAGTYQGCSVSKAFGSGNSLDILIRLNRDIGSGLLDMIIHASSSSWQLEAGRTYPSRLWIDEEFLGLGGVNATHTNAAFVGMAYSLNTFRSLEQGHELKFRVNKKNAFYSLKGSAKALVWLESCMKQGLSGVGREDGTSPERWSATGNPSLRNIRSILDGAGLIGYAMQSRDGADGVDLEEWRWGRGGGMKLIMYKVGRSFHAAFAASVASLKRGCDEWSSAHKDGVHEFEDGTLYGTSSFECVNDLAEIRYEVVAVDDNDGVTVIIQYSDVRDELDEAHRRVFSILHYMFE